MQLTKEEVSILAQTISPSIEHYREITIQSDSNIYDMRVLAVLTNLQQKLEAHDK